MRVSCQEKQTKLKRGGKGNHPLSAVALPSHSGLLLGFGGVSDGGRALTAFAAVAPIRLVSRPRHLPLSPAAQLAHLKDADDGHPDAHAAHETEAGPETLAELRRVRDGVQELLDHRGEGRAERVHDGQRQGPHLRVPGREDVGPGVVDGRQGPVQPGKHV